MDKIRIGTRGSALALWQTDHVMSLLHERFKDLEIEAERIKTTGDKILDVALAKIGDKGLFTKEIEAALLDGTVDLAVHSSKDLPTELPEGLFLAATLERADVRDALISKSGLDLDALPAGARIGTSSLRRRAQLLHYRADLQLFDLRGNLDTRLKKLDSGELDAVMLASAGLDRMGWSNRITQRIPVHISLPAVAQGAIGIEIRIGDERIQSIIETLNHQPTYLAVRAERALMHELEGGCQVPIGAHAEWADGMLSMTAIVASLDGRRLVRDSITLPDTDPEAVGLALAKELRALGADDILEEIRSEQEEHPQAGA